MVRIIPNRSEEPRKDQNGRRAKKRPEWKKSQEKTRMEEEPRNNQNRRRAKKQLEQKKSQETTRNERKIEWFKSDRGTRRKNQRLIGKFKPQEKRKLITRFQVQHISIYIAAKSDRYKRPESKTKPYQWISANLHYQESKIRKPVHMPVIQVGFQD